MLGEPILDYQMTGRVAQPRANFDIEFAPHNNYPCAGEDSWVAIAVGPEDQWREFCLALGNPEWCRDHRFADKNTRLRNVGPLDQHVAEWTRQHTPEEVTQTLQSHGVAAMPIMNIEDQFSDPHWQQRQAYAQVEHPHLGVEWLYGIPWLLSDTPGSIRSAAPTLGQHNDYVFGQLMGLSATEIERLQAGNVIY